MILLKKIMADGGLLGKTQVMRLRGSFHEAIGTMYWQ